MEQLKPQQLFLSDFKRLKPNTIKQAEILVKALLISNNISLTVKTMPNGLQTIQRKLDNGEINQILAIKLRLLVLNPTMEFTIKNDLDGRNGK